MIEKETYEDFSADVQRRTDFFSDLPSVSFYLWGRERQQNRRISFLLSFPFQGVRETPQCAERVEG